jgi:hypothetical protein
MRREWSAEELIGGWTLIEEDCWRLLGNKSGTTRLGFGVLLKYSSSKAASPATPATCRAPLSTTSPIR